eukprot:763726-Hanusia_phi.AAC.2
MHSFLLSSHFNESRCDMPFENSTGLQVAKRILSADFRTHFAAYLSKSYYSDSLQIVKHSDGRNVRFQFMKAKWKSCIRWNNKVNVEIACVAYDEGRGGGGGGWVRGGRGGEGGGE